MKMLEMKITDQKSILGQVRKELQNSIRVREGFSPKTRQGTRFGLNRTGNMVNYVMETAKQYPPEQAEEDEIETVWSTFDAISKETRRIVRLIAEDRFADAQSEFLAWTLQRSSAACAGYLAYELGESSGEDLSGKAAACAADCICNGREQEIVEMGLAILEVFPEADDAVKDAVFKLAFYEELTEYAAPLFIPLFGETEGKRRLRFLARHTFGKGRKAVKECLNPKPEE